MREIPVLFDTDIGSDIDDAVALAYLLKQPRCELLGITTVTGESELRASLADAICQAAGRPDVPIHVGVEPPLIAPPRQTKASQAEALADRWPHRKFTRESTAIEFMRQTVRSRPGEVALLATGPLTNVALLFAIDPEIPTLLKELVIMGGRYLFRSRSGGSVVEWNILCDPHAAAMVFAAAVPRLVAVGLDVTEECRMPADECRARFAKAGGPLAPVADMAEVWFRHANVITFHDPLAAAVLFDDSFCTLQPRHVEIDLHSVRACGQTVLVHDAPEKKHYIAEDVNADRFFQHYFEIVGS